MEGGFSLTFTEVSEFGVGVGLIRTEDWKTFDDPSKVLARGVDPIMEPIEPYEQTGFFGNVVFANGHYVKGDDIFLYYGASDEVICGARLSISEILSTLQ